MIRAEAEKTQRTQGIQLVMKAGIVFARLLQSLLEDVNELNLILGTHHRGRRRQSISADPFVHPTGH